MSILLISNKQDLTADVIVDEIHKRKLDFYRFNTEELGESVYVSLDITNDHYFIYDKHLNKIWNLRDFSSVYYRRPVLPSYNDANLSNEEKSFLLRENLKTIEGLYKLLSASFWINPVFATREAENKIWQMKLARDIGFEIPKSLISNYPATFHKFTGLNRNCVVKCLGSASLSKDSDKIVFTHKLDKDFCNEQIEFCPTYVQQNIPRLYDIRVIVIDNDAFAFSIKFNTKDGNVVDWRESDDPILYEYIEIPLNVKEKCILITHDLGLLFGAIDLIRGLDGNFYFLEINPNGQWAWLEAETGIKLSSKIVDVLTHERY